MNFASVFNVTDPHAQQASFKLSGKSVPRLRMKAVNQFGASRPSLTTEEAICSTTPPTVGKIKMLLYTSLFEGILCQKYSHRHSTLCKTLFSLRTRRKIRESLTRIA